MSNRRPAYSLIELIVVIGIAAVLCGLLLSAVQKVRASAAKSACSNHLKQLTLAMTVYHDMNQRLPPGISSGIGLPLQYLNWQPRLLPFMGQNAVYDIIESDYLIESFPFSTQTRHQGMSYVSPLFSCPSDSRPSSKWTVNQYDGNMIVTVTAYLANSGRTSNLKDGVLFKNLKRPSSRLWMVFPTPS